MSSYAWLRLKNFRVPLGLRIKCMFGRLLTLGKVKPRYSCDDDTVLLRVEFEGDYLEMIVEHFRKMVGEWGRQNNIPL
jgi:hypothetical protein